MSTLFDPIRVGGLTLRNRLMRSATAERLSDAATGAPRPALRDMYLRLAEGGVGLIVTGHAYVDRSGQAHPEMSSMANHRLIDVWRQTIEPAQSVGARVMMQINHAGASVDPAVNPAPLSPSGIPTNDRVRPTVMSEADIWAVIRSFGEAAWRVREAGFDGLQIHGAHGYLVSQFLSSQTNRREDAWGGGEQRRRVFLERIIEAVRQRVGPDFPIWIKLGVAGAAASGLTAEEGARAAALCAEMGVDCVETSHALGIPEGLRGDQEAPYLPLAEKVRCVVGDDYPLALVQGLRSLETMNAILNSGVVQIISMSRPLIAEPDLPSRLARGEVSRAACESCGQCWPKEPGEGVRCHNPRVAAQVLG